MRSAVLEFLTTSPWAAGVVAYSVGFWAVLFWIFVDARRRGRRNALLTALGFALIFPVGAFIYMSVRDWD